MVNGCCNNNERGLVLLGIYYTGLFRSDLDLKNRRNKNKHLDTNTFPARSVIYDKQRNTADEK